MSIFSENQLTHPLSQIDTLSLIQHIKSKFPHHSLDIIIQSLQNRLQVKKEHVQDKSEKKEHFIDQSHFSQEKTEDMSSFYQSISQKSSVQKKKDRRRQEIQRRQEIRLIAQTYIQGGLNYNNVKDICPSISSKFYRNTVEGINNSVIIQMERYLRYQCNIQIQRLNRDHKRSIRTQLTRIRQWLGKRDVSQLQTFYKFIQKKYQLTKVDISIEEALRLYKTILQIVKSPFVDVLEDEIKTQELKTFLQDAENSQKDDPEKTLILLFIHHRNLTKISDILCEKYGYELKYSKHSIKHQMKKILKNSIRKLVASAQAYQDKNVKLFFSQSDKCIDLLSSFQSALELKISLLSFYLQKNISLIQLRQLIKNTNKFFIRQYKDHGLNNLEDMKVRVKIPKLEKQTFKKQELMVKKVQKNEDVEQNVKIQPQPNISQSQNKQVKKQEQNQNQNNNNQNLIWDAMNDEDNKKIQQIINSLCGNFCQNETNIPDLFFQNQQSQI